MLQLDQGGLGLQDRNDYFKDENSSSQIISYKSFMTKIAELFNVSKDDAKKFADATFLIEKKLAEVCITNSQFCIMILDE